MWPRSSWIECPPPPELGMEPRHPRPPHSAGVFPIYSPPWLGNPSRLGGIGSGELLPLHPLLGPWPLPGCWCRVLVPTAEAIRQRSLPSAPAAAMTSRPPQLCSCARPSPRPVLHPRGGCISAWAEGGRGWEPGRLGSFPSSRGE